MHVSIHTYEKGNQKYFNEMKTPPRLKIISIKDTPSVSWYKVYLKGVY
jgi:hypothetical protein